MSDRTVHAVLRAPYDVVRYDRAGKWYLEGHGEMAGRRKQITIIEAVRLVHEDAAQVYLGLPGGSTFDARLRALTDA